MLELCDECKEIIKLKIEPVKSYVNIFYTTIENTIVLNEYKVETIENFLKEYLGFEKTEIAEFTKEVKKKVLEQFENHKMDDDILNSHIFYSYKDFVVDKIFDCLV